MANVGALIKRPRSGYGEFAETRCEYVTFMCRAISDRPYDIHGSLPDKLQFEQQ